MELRQKWLLVLLVTLVFSLFAIRRMHEYGNQLVLYVYPPYATSQESIRVYASSGESMTSFFIPPLPPVTRNITRSEIKKMKRIGWSSPIVVNKYKLLFLPIEKNGCTQWKQLFHLMENQTVPLEELHNPSTNKLKYLMRMKDVEVKRIVLDPNWTIATMVREPRSRLLSGFFHMKGSKDRRFRNKTFPYFVNYVKNHISLDVHWAPQVSYFSRMDV